MNYDKKEDVEFDEELEAFLGKFWLKCAIGMTMDSVGLMVMFLICDISLKGPLSYIYYLNPFDWVISTGYPLRLIYGGFLMFALVWMAHLIASVVYTVKYGDRPHKYLARIFRTYFQRIEASNFKKRS